MSGPTLSQSPNQDKDYIFESSVVIIIAYARERSLITPWIKERISPKWGTGVFLPCDDPHHASSMEILTCSHVVVDANVEDGVKIIIPSQGQTQLPVRIKAISPETDLALLECDMGQVPHDVTCFGIGDDHRLRRGDTIRIYGYPLQVNNLLISQCTFNGRPEKGLQIDGAVNHGSSGGPVIHEKQIIGIVSAGVSPESANSTSYAIPISSFHSISKRMREKIKIEAGKESRGKGQEWGTRVETQKNTQETNQNQVDQRRHGLEQQEHGQGVMLF
jgi:S1-C subfamily serine protease